MGIAQFSFPLAEYNQDQLDYIKQIVDDLKDTDIVALSAQISAMKVLSAGEFHSLSTGTAQAQTVLDITGAGIVTYLYPGVSSINYSIQVDGGSIYLLSGIYSATVMIPFSTSITIKGTGTGQAGYILF